MLDERAVLSIERTREALATLRAELRRRYSTPERQVVADDLRKSIAQLAETWMVEVAGDADVASATGAEVASDLSVRFQRLLTYSERSTTRAKYDLEIKAILKDFANRVVVPLKQAIRSGRTQLAIAPLSLADEGFVPSAFVGHSFAPADRFVVHCAVNTLEAIGLSVETGQRPAADRVSDKVRRLIDEQHIFVGVFSRREKLVGRSMWNTSAWVIDEKAYALSKGKKLILLKENGVVSIGGIQGDYEYVEFSKDSLHDIPVALMRMFLLSSTGFR